MIDTHCHIHFHSDYKEIIENTKLKEIVCLWDIDEIENKPEIWEFLNDKVHTAIGIHPNKAHKIPYEKLEKYVEKYSKTITAIGESGIDLHYSTEEQLPIQIEMLNRHLYLCEKYNKPLVIHSRNCSIDIIIDQLKNANIPVILHSFNYGWEQAQKALNHNFWISLSGMVTFKSCGYLQEVVEKIPLDKLLLETDSPFLTPVPHRGKTNYPDYVRYNYQYVSKFKNLSLDQVEMQIDKNFYKAFLVN